MLRVVIYWQLMKLYIVLTLFALAAAAPKVSNKEDIFSDIDIPVTNEDRSLLVNMLIRQLINYIRHIINNGSAIFEIPPLDPLVLEYYRLYIPAGLINLDLELENAEVTGFGDFVVHKSDLNLSELSFDIEISVPKIDVRTVKYKLIGDFFTAIPLYGNGNIIFEIEAFRFRAKLYLKQSEDGESVLIESIQNASFEIPKVKSQLTGVIGGGDIDLIANAVIEEVLFDYVNRFQGAIAALTSEVIVLVGNPILNQLDTWRYISVLL